MYLAFPIHKFGYIFRPVYKITVNAFHYISSFDPGFFRRRTSNHLGDADFLIFVSRNFFR